MTVPRPVLGIIACNRSVGEEAAQTVIDRYVEAAMRYADAAALIVPARPDLMRADEVAGRIDGLLLTGSPSNVDPARYGDSGGDGPFDRGRDEMAAALIEAMVAAGKPVFGICRGFQEIIVAFGGTLARDMGGEDRPLPHHAPADAGLDAMFDHRHPVALAPGGVLARALGCDSLGVRSVHYQGAATLGEGLTVEATAPDGVVEAVSARRGESDIVAVQWHPEWQTDDDPPARAFFALLGRALRGEAVASPCPEPVR